MAGVSLRLLLLAVIMPGTVESASAQHHDATPAEQTFAALEARYASSTALPSPPTKQPIQQAAYVSTPNAMGPTLPASHSPTAVLPTPTVIPPAGGPSIYPSPQPTTEVIIPPSSDAWCMPPQPPCRTSSWFAATEFIATNSHVGRAEFGPWTDDGVLSLRFILGYEDPRGLGIRARAWGLGQEDCARFEDVDLQAGAFDLDLYKRFFIEDAELVLGGGASSRGLEFQQDGNGHSRFEGGGVSMFTEGFLPLLEFPNCEIGQTGRVRATLLTGDWHDTSAQGPDGSPLPGNIVPGTDHDGMTVFEFGWGLEFRRRFGEADDHSWYVALLAEHQRWQSDWMGTFMGSSISFTGLNLSSGVSW